MKSKILLIFLVAAALTLAQGCGVLNQTVDSVSDIVSGPDTATVIAKTAQIRTSYAVVAADLLEVKRGDRLDVLDQVEFEKVLWLRVRAGDEARTEGWIEAQNVITNNLLERSIKLAGQFRDAPPQAVGQLRAVSNLRLSPDMNQENVLFKLANGSTFEIMDWKLVPKQELPEVDAAKGPRKPAGRTKNEDVEAAGIEDDVEKLEDKYDIWYQVRLDPSVSPAPAGWLFGRQVELQIPSDIVYYQESNRKFVGWQRLDTDSVDKAAADDKASTPGNWVVLARSNAVKAADGDEPAFDRVAVLAFDKYEQSYYTAWRSAGDVWGALPLRVEGMGDNKSFIVRLRGPDGKLVDKRFALYKDKGRLKVTPPDDIAQFQQPKSK